MPDFEDVVGIPTPCLQEVLTLRQLPSVEQPLANYHHNQPCLGKHITLGILMGAMPILMREAPYPQLLPATSIPLLHVPTFQLRQKSVDNVNSALLNSHHHHLSEAQLRALRHDPYDNTWMSRHQINQIVLSSFTAKHKLESLFQHGALKAGDELVIPQNDQFSPYLRFALVSTYSPSALPSLTNFSHQGHHRTLQRDNTSDHPSNM